MKEEKLKMEEYILKYFEDDEDAVPIKIASGKLTERGGELSRHETTRKGAINRELIKESIYEHLKKEKIIKDDDKCRKLAEKTCELIEDKRPVKTRVSIKRTFDRKPRVKKGTKKGTKKQTIVHKSKKNTKIHK